MRASPTRLWTFYSDFDKFVEKYVDGIEQETTDAMTIGSAVDDLLSYGAKEFVRKYEIKMPNKKRDKESKYIQLTNSMGATSIDAAIAYAANPKIDVLNKRYKAQAEGMAVINGVECYCLADRYDEEAGIIRDYKTTGSQLSESPEDFHNISEQWGYYFKMAFYNMIFGSGNHCVLDYYAKRNGNTHVLVIPQDIMIENTLKVEEALVSFKQFLKTYIK